MTKLSYESLTTFNHNDLGKPNYLSKTTRPKIGIVHLGPGAFFRGHQAWYTHQAMKIAGGDWGISCVSMRSAGVADALNPQDGLYVLAELDETTHFEVIGAVQEVLVAGRDYAKVLERLTHADTRIVTMTITEKGYCLNSAGELNLDHEDIQYDLKHDQKFSAIGLLTVALKQRHEQGLAPLTLLSCDNVTDNGKKLKSAIVMFAKQQDTELAIWLETHLICPCSMVDSITPATDDALKQQIKTELEIEDNWPIKRESFVQWVIEDTLPEPKPAWQHAGATFTQDVQGFENAKLRLLNCPHSTLAYLGVLLGIETVYDAMLHPQLVSFIHQLVNREVIPSFVPPKELDVTAYFNAILNRFRNPAIRHLLSQIAWDGSQKLPMRILPIIEGNLKNDGNIEHLCLAVAAWCLFIRKRYQDSEALVDPLSEGLLAVAANCTGDAKHDIALFLEQEGVFGHYLATHSVFAARLANAYDKLKSVLDTSTIDWDTLIS